MGDTIAPPINGDGSAARRLPKVPATIVEEAEERLDRARRSYKPTIETPTTVRSVHEALVALSERVDRAEGSMRTNRILILATLLVAMLSVASSASVILAIHDLREPVSRLGDILDRLERRLSTP